jgi:hypothetical protein
MCFKCSLIDRSDGLIVSCEARSTRAILDRNVSVEVRTTCLSVWVLEPTEREMR